MRKRCLVVIIALVFISSFFQVVHAQDGGSDLVPVAVFPIIGEKLWEARWLNGLLMDLVRELGTFDPVALPHAPEYPDIPPDRDMAGNMPYALTGALFPDDDDKIHVQIWLYDMEKEELIFTEEMVYTDPDEAVKYLSPLTSLIISKAETPAAPVMPVAEETAPEETAAAEETAAPEKTEAESEKTAAFRAEEGIKDSSEKPEAGPYWLYLGLKGGGSLRFYNPHGEPVFTEKSNMNATFEAGLQVSSELLEFGKLFSLGLQAEALFTRDTVVFSEASAGEENFEYVQMLFPLLVKFNIHPGRFVISPYGGIYYPLPLADMKYSRNGRGNDFEYSYSLALGYIGGISLGTMLGPGRLFLDARYAADLGEIRNTATEKDLFGRNMITVSIGYELGLFRKQTRRNK
ncbi:MAG: hypothetical protein LBC57_02680 [Treponema sp.]|nr:hypothetical protein [Treponema sp.]